jgi:hypothetical protein
VIPSSIAAWPRAARVAAAGAVVAIVLAGCSVVSRTPPAPTPADFLGISSTLVRQGISIDHVVAGDPGCADQNLGKTAIAFRASGLDQTTPVPVHLYIFGSRESFVSRRGDIDACARSYATDPATFEAIDASPYVIAGQGPWAPKFAAALRAALTEAAGTGD